MTTKNTEADLPKSQNRMESGLDARSYLGSAFHVFYFKNKPFLKMLAYPDDAVNIQLYADITYTDAALKLFSVMNDIGYIKYDQAERDEKRIDELEAEVSKLKFDVNWKERQIRMLEEKDKDRHRLDIENRVLKMRVEAYERIKYGAL